MLSQKLSIILIKVKFNWEKSKTTFKESVVEVRVMQFKLINCV